MRIIVTTGVNKMKMLKKEILRFAIGVAVVAMVAGSLAMACPKGTHPVCHDPKKGKSVCHCVPSEQDDWPAKSVRAGVNDGK
jgi:hypothetical protein